MRGSIWSVIVVGVLLAVSPAVLKTDFTPIAENFSAIFGQLSVVAGLLLFVVAMGAFGRYVFGGGGGF
jgi:hypothetical protein